MVFVLESHCQLDSLLPTKSQCMLSLEEWDKNSRTKYNCRHYWKKKLPLNPACAKVPKHRYIWQSNNHWLTLIQNSWHIKRADGLTDLNYYFSLLVNVRVNSLKKTLMLGKIEGRRRRGLTEDEMVGWLRWLNGHEFELQKTVKGSLAVVNGVAKCWTWLRNWTAKGT